MTARPGWTERLARRLWGSGIPLQSALLVTHAGMLLLPVVLLLGTGALAHDQANQREKELTREGRLVVALLEARLGPALADPARWGEASPVLAEVYRITGVGARLVDSERVVRATNGPRAGERLEDRPELAGALGGQATAVSRRGIPAVGTSPEAERAWSFAALPIEAGGRVQGALVVVHASREPVEVMAAMSRELGWGAAVATLVAFGAAIYAGWRLSRSLRALAGVADGVAEGRDADLGRIAHTRVAEVRRLAHAFERMTLRLQERIRYNEDFASHVSHEFKTPLTTLAGTMTLLAEDADMPAEQRRRFLDNARTDVDRLQRMVQGLLELARVESADRSETIALDEILGDVADRYRVGFQPGALAVRGNPSLIELAAVNLVENALTHGGPPVVLRSFAGGFVVEDGGPGISPANLPRVFERFFTTGRDRQGTGLGLALVRAVARAHGGDVTVESRPGRTVFTVTLDPGSGGSPRAPG